MSERIYTCILCGFSIPYPPPCKPCTDTLGRFRIGEQQRAAEKLIEEKQP